MSALSTRLHNVGDSICNQQQTDSVLLKVFFPEIKSSVECAQKMCIEAMEIFKHTEALIALVTATMLVQVQILLELSTPISEWYTHLGQPAVVALVGY